jgi:hypothetical protein
VVALILIAGAAAAGTAPAQTNKPTAPDVAVGTAFTYQGQFHRSGTLFTGPCNLQFSMWDAASSM